jgi:SnoaL-like domain
MFQFEPEMPHLGASPGWAHMIGEVSLPSAPTCAADLVARAEIEELVARCWWARDERRADVLGACLAEDAVWAGSVAGSVGLGPIAGRERILAWQRDGWRLDSGQCRHLPLNTTFLVHEEARAATASYLLLAESRQDVFTARAAGFLRADHVRAEVGWRIARMFVGWDAPPWAGSVEHMTERERHRHGLAVAEIGGETVA